MNKKTQYQCQKCKEYFRTYGAILSHKCIEDIQTPNTIEKRDRIEWISSNGNTGIQP